MGIAIAQDRLHHALQWGALRDELGLTDVTLQQVADQSASLLWVRVGRSPAGYGRWGVLHAGATGATKLSMAPAALAAELAAKLSLAAKLGATTGPTSRR
eukprot:gene17080-biopygen3784